MTNLSTLFPTKYPSLVYTPASFYFDGNSWYYQSYTAVSRQITVTGRFRQNSFTGSGTQQAILRAYDASGSRVYMQFYSNDHSTVDYRDTIRILTQNTAGTIICDLIAPIGYLDGEWHSFLYAFDSLAGTAVFIIHGEDADDTGNPSRVAPTIGVMDTGTLTFVVGNSTVAIFRPLIGELGAISMSESYIIDPTLFSNPDDSQKKINEVTWEEWGTVQPMFFNEHGYMLDNRGSKDNMAVTGILLINDEPEILAAGP